MQDCLEDLAHRVGCRNPEERPPMSQETPKLGLPVMMPAQAQKHITHNAALELLDLAVQLTLESEAASTAPTSPAEGESWAVPAVL